MSNMISSMSDCSESDIFWKSFSTMPCNPYLLNSGIDDFKCLFIHLSKGRDFSMYDYPIAYGYMASLLRMNHGKAKILILDVDEFNKDLKMFNNLNVKNLVVFEVSGIMSRSNPKEWIEAIKGYLK